MRPVAIALSLLLWAAPCLHGQPTGRGRLHGRVTDSSGLPLPGVTITLAHEGAGPLVTHTDEVGQYSFDVPWGRYAVTADLSGFESVTRAAVGGLTLTGFAVNRSVDYLRSDLTLARRRAGRVPPAPSASRTAVRHDGPGSRRVAPVHQPGNRAARLPASSHLERPVGSGLERRLDDQGVIPGAPGLARVHGAPGDHWAHDSRPWTLPWRRRSACRSDCQRDLARESSTSPVATTAGIIIATSPDRTSAASTTRSTGSCAGRSRSPGTRCRPTPEGEPGGGNGVGDRAGWTPRALAAPETGQDLTR